MEYMLIMSKLQYDTHKYNNEKEDNAFSGQKIAKFLLERPNMDKNNNVEEAIYVRLNEDEDMGATSHNELNNDGISPMVTQSQIDDVRKMSPKATNNIINFMKEERNRIDETLLSSGCRKTGCLIPLETCNDTMLIGDCKATMQDDQLRMNKLKKLICLDMHTLLSLPIFLLISALVLAELALYAGVKLTASLCEDIYFFFQNLGVNDNQSISISINNSNGCIPNDNNTLDGNFKTCNTDNTTNSSFTGICDNFEDDDEYNHFDETKQANSNQRFMTFGVCSDDCSQTLCADIYNDNSNRFSHYSDNSHFRECFTARYNNTKCNHIQKTKQMKNDAHNQVMASKCNNRQAFNFYSLIWPFSYFLRNSIVTQFLSFCSCVPSLFSTFAILLYPAFSGCRCILFFFPSLLYRRCKQSVLCRTKQNDHVLSLSSKKNKMFNESQSYSEYLIYGLELDEITGRSDWKKVISSNNCDLSSIQRKTNSLRKCRTDNNLVGLFENIRIALNNDLGNLLTEKFYSKTYIGTKYIIHNYINEICVSIDFIAKIYKNNIDNCIRTKACIVGHANNHTLIDEKYVKEYIERSTDILISSWGSTALFLSGGAMLGMHHFGLCETLIVNSVNILETKKSEWPEKQNLLPKIICGTSAGAVVAAWICTRGDEEIYECLKPDYLAAAFSGLRPNNWLHRFWNMLTKGHMCDIDYWIYKTTQLFGNMTFLEAFIKTGKILSITITRADSQNRDTVLLNYKTAPNVVISTAVLASSAFPYLGTPIQLKEKTLEGTLKDSLEFQGFFFHDGSLSNDIPLRLLQNIFPIGFTIVSQVNLHVFPFSGSRVHGEAGLPIHWRGSRGRWKAGFLISATELFLKENMRFLLRLIAVLDVSPTYRGINCASIALQSYTGNVTIHPRRISWKHIKFANDLNISDVEWFYKEGRLMTYPKLSLIINRMKIDRALERLVSTISSNVQHK